jgi:hypothetical protein
LGFFDRFKFVVKVGVEESIVNALPITDHGSALYTSGAFTVDSSMLALTGNLNEHLNTQYKEMSKQNLLSEKIVGQ